MNSPKNPRVAVIVVSYNSATFLESCLNSIRENFDQIEHEVCVVDNHSQDESTTLVRKKFPEYKLIENRTNFGFAKAINQGLWETTAPYVLWLNPDAQILNKELPTLVQFIEDHPDVGIVGPKILDPDGGVQLSCRRFPGYAHYFFGRHALLTRLFPNNPISKKYVHLDSSYEEIRRADWVSGAAFLHRRELIHEVGLLDEGFFMYFEEVDYCRRALGKGWKTYYHPACVIQHQIAGSSRQISSKTLMIRHQSNWRYYTKYFKRNKIKDLIVASGLVLRCLFKIVISKVPSKS